MSSPRPPVPPPAPGSRSSPFASRVQRPDSPPAGSGAGGKGLGPKIAIGVGALVVVGVGAFFAIKSFSDAGDPPAPPAPGLAQQIQQPPRPEPTQPVQQPAAQPAPVTPPTSSSFGLVNGDMTQGTDRATGWDRLSTVSGRIEAARDTSNFRSAPASLRISTGGGTGEGQVAQKLQLPNRNSFVIGGWVMSAGTARVTFGVQFYDASDRPIQFSEILFTDRSVRWTRASLRIDPPAQAASFAIVFYIAGAGQAWLDDVTVEEFVQR